ncbi:MAG: hypothetical protein ACLP9S_04590 [Syntrophales bacterium]
MRRLMTITFVFFLLFPIPLNAEIEKVAQLCKEEICFYWWPKLTSVKGWHHERGPSNVNAINVQVPDGFSFSDAETVIYAKAIYKPRSPETTSLEMLIKDDKEIFLSRDSSIIVSEVEPLKTADGKLLRSFTFFPKSRGNWERVSYGEEGDFYLIFTMSSRTNEGYAKALETYRQYINQYREKP